MGIVEMFEFFLEVSCYIEITVEYCWKITFYTFQGCTETVYRCL